VAQSKQEEGEQNQRTGPLHLFARQKHVDLSEEAGKLEDDGSPYAEKDLNKVYHYGARSFA